MDGSPLLCIRFLHLQFVGQGGMTLEALFAMSVGAVCSPETESEVWMEESKVHVEIQFGVLTFCEV